MPIRKLDGDDTFTIVCINTHSPRKTMQRYPEDVALLVAPTMTQGIACHFYRCSVCNYVELYTVDPE